MDPYELEAMRDYIERTREERMGTRERALATLVREGIITPDGQLTELYSEENGMTPEERMEANANRVLWCVHVIGPDDVYAEPSHAVAVANAEKLNRAVWSRPNVPDDVTCFAFADTWPWSAEAHAEAMTRQAKEEAARKPALAAKPI